MLVQESLLGETLHSKDMQDTTDEADETLSLCDLPLYSEHHSVEEWEEDLSAESQGSSSMSSSSEQDYFEFFSQELSPSTTGFPPENIIFCGKLIPYKQPDTSEKVSSKVVENKKQTNIKKKHGWSIFGWKYLSSSRSSKRQVQSKSGKKSTTIVNKKDHHQSPKKTYNSNKHGKGYGFPVHKMSILTSSSAGKGRWYFYLFGISRFSSEVELRDIKSRQSRRHCPPPSPELRFQNHDEKVSGGTNGGSGLWGLIRVLSCAGNHHPNTMAVGSISTRQKRRFSPIKTT